MKKAVLAFSAICVLVAIGAFGWNYMNKRHPQVSCSDGGCTFTYELCRPMPAPMTCLKQPFTLIESFGWDTNFMPYPKRDHEFTTVQELRREAEARADMIENIRAK